MIRWRRKLLPRAIVLSDEGRMTWRLEGDSSEGERFVAGGQRERWSGSGDKETKDPHPTSWF